MTTTTPLSPVLTEALVRRALVVYHGADSENEAAKLKVTNCAFKLSSVNGENFCSDIYIAEVKYELDGNALENSFIVKIMLSEMVEISSNEDKMYSIVLPGMGECLRKSGNDIRGTKLHARCLVSERNEHEFYVMENLNSLGYFCEDRVQGLDEAHSTVLMRKLGEFHAASMVYAKQHPDVIAALNKSHFANGATDFVAKTIAFGGLQFVSEMIETWPGYEHLAPKVKNVMSQFDALVMEAVDPEKAVVCVLNHGDVWVNNVLYKSGEDGRRPEDVLFVDFQVCFWGGCGFDINWLLNTSMQLQVLKEKRWELIKMYYDSLRTTLEASLFPAADVPSWEAVVQEVRRSEIIGLYTSLCELPIVALERAIAKDFTLNSYLDEEKMLRLRKSMYANERVKATLRYSLKYFEEIGIFS